jgi:hypothetical protein
MISPERRKKDILRSIELNPTNISIKNIVKVEKDGAFEEIETTLDITVRIYNQKSSEVNVSSDKKGTSYTSRKYGMLMDHTVEQLEIDNKSSIEFKCIYGNLKIVAIYPQIVKGIICGYQCDLERID